MVPDLLLDSIGLINATTERVDKIDIHFGKPVANASDYLIFGNAEYAKGNYFKALEQYEKALKVNPDYSDAWSNMGTIAERFNKFSIAAKAYQRALEKEPNHKVARERLGNLLTYVFF